MNDKHRQMPTKDTILKQLGHDRLAAHQVLFGHRHPNKTPPFHDELIELWHCNAPRILVMAFREAGKSTIAEEAFVIGAAYRLFHNALIVGSTEKRATERLRAIKHEIATNELLQTLFGNLIGPVWNEAEVILSNGVRIIAAGRGQSLRGTKHLHYRPDFVFCDDIEDKEHVVTPDAREATQAWFMEELLPALDRNARLRMNATPLDRDALPMRIVRWPHWLTRIYPIESVNVHGERTPAWPDRYSLDWIDAKRLEYESAGDLEGYAREYMCVAEDPRTKIFTADMMVVRPRVRTWEATYAAYDPARTTQATSATTGWAVWSYLGGSRMVVWDAGGAFWKPDEIIDHLFAVNDSYAPVAIGVEQDGLNEFILQPLRAEALRRNTVIPLRALKAPKGKLDFISGLQPYFNGREITFAKELPELTKQLLNFPTGKIDAPNALAYALKMKPGQVVYEDFAAVNVAENLAIHPREPIWLALNEGQGYTTAVAAQLIGGALHVLWDAVREGDASAILAEIVRQAQLEMGPVRLCAGDSHYLSHSASGLRAAVAHLPAELRHGGKPEVGRDEIRRLLRTQAKGQPAFACSQRARWTLNGLASGYARNVNQRGALAEEADTGPYRVLLEGLESFTALLKIGTLSDSRPNYRTTEGGQRYVSALPNRLPVNPSKDDWSAEPASSFRSARR